MFKICPKVQKSFWFDRAQLLRVSDLLLGTVPYEILYSKTLTFIKSSRFSDTKIEAIICLTCCHNINKKEHIAGQNEYNRGFLGPFAVSGSIDHGGTGIH